MSDVSTLDRNPDQGRGGHQTEMAMFWYKEQYK